MSFSTRPNNALNSVHNCKPAYAHLNHHYHYNMYISTVIIMVMWSPKVTYFNVLKFLNTRGSASARAPSSPISLHWTSSHSRLYIYTSRSKTKCIITVFHFVQISSVHQSINQFALTSILPMTCFVAVLLPELWLQWRSKNCSRHCSGGYTRRQ